MSLAVTPASCAAWRVRQCCWKFLGPAKRPCLATHVTAPPLSTTLVCDAASGIWQATNETCRRLCDSRRSSSTWLGTHLHLRHEAPLCAPAEVLGQRSTLNLNTSKIHENERYAHLHQSRCSNLPALGLTRPPK
jgi:hypothetical protein